MIPDSLQNASGMRIMRDLIERALGCLLLCAMMAAMLLLARFFGWPGLLGGVGIWVIFAVVMCILYSRELNKPYS